GLDDRHLVIDRADTARRDRVVATAGIGIALGQHDAIAAHLVDGADMRPVGADHLHLRRHPAKRAALSLAFVAPGAEFLLEPGAILAAIFVIVAVERGDLAAAPAVIIVVAAIVEAVVPRVALATTLGLFIAKPRTHLV